MDKQFCLEIYEPGTAREAAAVFESDEPFMMPVVGTLLNPGFWETSASQNSGNLLRVVAVEHIIWRLEGRGLVKQKACIFTEAVLDNEAARLKAS